MIKYQQSADTIESLRAQLAERDERIKTLEEIESRYYSLLELDSSDIMVDTLNTIETQAEQLKVANSALETLLEGSMLRDGINRNDDGMRDALWQGAPAFKVRAWVDLLDDALAKLEEAGS